MMRKCSYILLFGLIIGILFCGNLQAQDLHFSQFFNSPLTENPANTGFLPDANYRFGANYRNQWSVTGAPYKTTSVYGDAQLLRDKWYSGWLGVGGVLLQDEAGAGALKSTKLYLSIAYHQLLGQNSLLSLGFNGGMAMKRLDMSKLTFPDQYNDSYGEWFFDHNVPTNVTLDHSTISYFDLQTGMNYAYFPTNNIYINMGFSAHHLNRPKESFLKNGENEIGRRYIGFFNASIKLSPRLIINPNAYYTFQRGANETVAGAWAAYNLSGPGTGGDYQLLAGAYYRLGDAFIPLVGYQLKKWRIMFSYDVTTSSFGAADDHRGAYELSLTFSGIYSQLKSYNKKQYICPHF